MVAPSVGGGALVSVCVEGVPAAGAAGLAAWGGGACCCCTFSGIPCYHVSLLICCADVQILIHSKDTQLHDLGY